MADGTDAELRLLQSVTEALGDGVLVIDSSNKIVSYNRKFAEMMEVPAPILATMDNQVVIDFIIQQIRNPEQFLVTTQVLDASPEKTLADVIKMKNGNVFERYSVPRYAGKEVVGRVVTIRDVTHRKQDEEALRLSEERFRTVFEAANFGITIFDTQGNFIGCNPAICSLLGYTEEEMKKLGIVGISHPDDYDATRNRLLISDMASGSIDKFDIQKRYIKKDRTIFWGHVIASLVRSEHGTPLFGVGLIIDVTRQKEAEKETQNAIRLRDEFIAVASHELRTPITPLKVQNQFLRRHLETGQFASYPEAKRVLKIIDISEQQLGHLALLVEDMLDASRIAAGRLDLNRAEENLSTVVDGVVSRYRDEFSRAGCALSLNIEPQLSARFDRLRVEQIVVNLITNALKYGRGKPIEISLFSTSKTANLVVRDYGIGIAKENHARIYDQFERVAPVKAYGGFGLGLYITRQIVQAHSGSIRVESELHKGATFTVELPLS